MWDRSFQNASCVVLVRKCSDAYNGFNTLVQMTQPHASNPGTSCVFLCLPLRACTTTVYDLLRNSLSEWLGPTDAHEGTLLVCPVHRGQVGSEQGVVDTPRHSSPRLVSVGQDMCHRKPEGGGGREIEMLIVVMFGARPVTRIVWFSSFRYFKSDGT